MNIIDLKINIEKTLLIPIDIKGRQNAAVATKVIFFILCKINNYKNGKIMELIDRKSCLAAHYSDLSITLLKFDQEFKKNYINCLKAINKNEEEISLLIQPSYLQNIIKKRNAA